MLPVKLKLEIWTWRLRRLLPVTEPSLSSLALSELVFRQETTSSDSYSFISPYPQNTSRPNGPSRKLETSIETLEKLIEDDPGTRELLEAVIKVVDCFDEQVLNVSHLEVTLYLALKENLKAMRTVKWYKPFRRAKTVKRIRRAIRNYVDTSATGSVSTATFDAHIDLLDGQSDSDEERRSKSDSEDNIEDLPWMNDIRDFLRSDRRLKSITSISPDDPCKVIDFLQLECDRNREDAVYHSRCIKGLFYMTRHHRLLPTSFSCRHAKQIGGRPVWGGGFANIWKGRMNGELICIKVLRIFMDNGIEERNKMIKNFCREALVWRNLFCLISPWMEYGNIMTCLSERPLQIQRIPAANILVKDDLSCCLSDFGLSLAVESQVGASSSSRAFLGGSLRWMPPEIMDDKQFDPAYITARDVYSFGCTVIEIYTGKPPFSHIRKEAAIINEVLTCGNLQDRPPDIPDWMWEKMVLKCLVSPASQRPVAQSLVNILTVGVNASNCGSTSDAEQLEQAGSGPSGEPGYGENPRKHTRGSVGR
ncbi:kinase-like domain-containing protein [Armillaria mellea]|nr:kinase-like domain-containing protein [Armillaria mellea]